VFIEQVQLHRFKQFKSTKVELNEGLSLLVGGNNAGKSSILHALAVWEFCKTILEFVRGRRAWTVGGGAQGIGVGISEFSPISVPSLKHLWTGLKTQRIDEPDGYTLKIRAIWSLEGEVKKHLEFGLSLTNDRLFIKTTSTNLTAGEVIGVDQNPISGVVPNIAYLPPFAGITDREARSSVAMRNRLIGQGLSGGVIRNVLYDMWDTNKEERKRLRGTKTKISSPDLASLRKTDSWELLLRALGDLFGMGLTVSEFDDRYHTYLNVETFRGKMNGPAIKRAKNDASRDLMVEGSGFLQWLSVYALALSPDVDVVLLDEPDAHLHASLQVELVRYLSDLAIVKQKQVLMATHSTELIKGFDSKSIIEVKGSKAKYLGEEAQKIGVLAGIGTSYSPRLHQLTQHRRLLIVEGTFDQAILPIWAEKLGIAWPEDVVFWVWTGGHKERRQLFTQLKVNIPGLRAISIRDRDEEADGSVGADLLDKGVKVSDDGFIAYKWRRRHIDNYLISTSAIARSSGKTEAEVLQFFMDKHALAPPADLSVSNVAMAIRDARGKEIMSVGPDSVEAVLKVTRFDVAKAMLPEEVPADVGTLLMAIRHFADH
jgi:predicted ATPase